MHCTPICWLSKQQHAWESQVPGIWDEDERLRTCLYLQLQHQGTRQLKIYHWRSSALVVLLISLWLYSAFVNLMKLWGHFNAQDLISAITAAFGFIITLMVYIRIYLTVQRHKNQIQSMQIRNEAQSEEIKNFTLLTRSIVSIFYIYLVFLICYLPYFICMAVIRIYGSTIVLKKLYLFSLTLMYLNSSLNPIIYCWKMRHIRHAIMDILRKMSWINNLPFRINYNRSSSVVHIDNWSPLCGLQRLWAVIVYEKVK